MTLWRRALRSNEIACVMTNGANAPLLTQQPVAVLAECSSNATFTVAASSYSPLSYQWLRNGSPVPGATAAALTVVASSNTAGSYSVSVSNCASAVVSASTALTVQDTIAPVILTCAPNVTIAAGALCLGAIPDLTTNVTATDACGPLTITQVPPPGTQFGPGPRMVTLTVTDGNGNTNACVALVTITDQTAPAFTQCATNAVLTAGANCLVALPDFRNQLAALDNCGAVTFVQTPPPGAFVSVGTNVITYRALDAASNSVTCTSLLIVRDGSLPVITNCAANVTVAAGTNCQGAIPDLTTQVVAGDACTPIVVTQSPMAGSAAAIGAHTVTLTVTDAGGNFVTCDATVTVTDQTAPVITNCATNLTLVAAANCQATVPDLTAQIGGYDNCSALTIIQTPAPGASVALGTNTITFLVCDAASNSVNCTSDLIVVDQTAPDLVACATNRLIAANASCMAALPDLTGNVSATDCNGPLVITQTPAVGTLVSTGATVVTLTIADAAGNTTNCQATVTVSDQTPPLITVCAPPLTLTADMFGQASLPNLTSQVSATDNCGVSGVTQSPSAGAILGVGDHTVTFTVSDAAGNTNTCDAIVSVVMGEVPPTVVTQPAGQSIECSSNVTFAVVANGTLPLSYQWFFGTNAIPDATNTSLTLAAVTAANNGSYAVVITNIAGSIVSSNALLAVADTIAPSINCPTNFTVQCFADVPLANFTGGSASDGCDPSPAVTHVGDVTNGSCPTTILRTYRAMDSSSNSVTCTQTITVHDTTPPVITCGGSQTFACAAVWSFTAPTAMDNCDGVLAPTIFSTATNATCGHAYVATRVWQATDTCGNSTLCTQVVTVVDITPPAITCGTNETYEFGVAWNFATPSVTDDCGPAGVTLAIVSTTTNANCGRTFTATRVWRATDGCSNSALCTQIITVIDTTPPTLACPTNLTVQCDGDVPPPNFAGGSVSDLGDAAPAVTHVGDVASGSCPKTIIRTYRATDACSNSITCAQTITVHDTTPPNITCSPNLVAKSFSTNGATVNFTVTATDNCTLNPAIVCAPASGSVFPLGTSTVNCTATDACTNSAACGFTINVLLADDESATVNRPIPDGSSLGLASVINVASPIGALTDVNVTLHITNGWNGDLFAYLVHDSGYAVLLNRAGRRLLDPYGYEDSGFHVTLDDQAASDVHRYRFALFGNDFTPLAGPLTNRWQPDGRTVDPGFVLDTDPRTAFLGSFNGMNPNGEWALFIEDDATGDVSTLVSWSLQLCGTVGVAPSITAQPQGVAAGCGDNVSFSVTAAGTGPVGYHWRRNGAAIAGANSATLSLTGVLPAQAGDYSVIVSNAFGAVTSSVATLAVSEQLPVIATQPQSRTNIVGTTATFGVGAVSCSALSYQWSRGGSPLPGATNASLTLANVQLSDAGSYRVVVVNAAGSVTSAVAVLTINRAPVVGDYGAATTEGRPVSIAVAKLLSSASDADGDPMTISAVSAMSTNGGGVVLSGGFVTYTPLAGFTGLDRFSFTVSDGRGGFDTGEVQVLVVSGTLPGLNQVSISATANGVLIRFAGIPGRTYQLQRAPTVTGPWGALTTAVAPLHGIIQYVDVNPPSPSFYRTVVP